jgi:Domain of unknown function (DUF4190)
VDEERNGSRETDWNAWAMPARRTTEVTGAPQPPPPPPPGPGAPGHWGSAPPPPPPAPSPYPGQWGAPPPYGPQPYGQQPYGGGYGAPYGGWARPAATNGLAVASMVCGILWLYWLGSILALVFGYVAKSQIDRSHGGQGGRGMATAGIVLGWVGVGFLVLFILLGILGAASDPSPNSF